MNVHSANRTGRAKRAGAVEKRGAVERRNAVEKRNADTAEKRGRGRPLVDDKRRIILDSALRVFAKKGYHGTAVPDVAEAAGVGTGTLYRYFANKEALVNEVYRDAKIRLRTAVMDNLVEPNLTEPRSARGWFDAIWARLGAFARSEPEAFRFLEMQDHVEYLDVKSRQLELSVLMPLWMAGKRLHTRDATAPVDMLIALLWGAFVGLVKANRLGYLALDDKRLAQAGAVCWRLIEPNVLKKTSRTKG
ncbi:MAG: TetR/AcrR family transcriptional regulator [Myxococcota bacterium]|nr:TetR/AcrR family transcriptional regulator [Myxococcota bacterium]